MAFRYYIDIKFIYKLLYISYFVFYLFDFFLNITLIIIAVFLKNLFLRNKAKLKISDNEFLISSLIILIKGKPLFH